MSVILFASPGILGPFIFATLIQLKEKVHYVVVPTTPHAVAPTELFDLAKQAGVPVLTPEDLSHKKFVTTLKQCAPDLIIVATFDRKIPAEVTTIPRCAALNIHSSYLPYYRGACPEFWVLRKGERETGVSIHYLSEKFDAGDVIVQEKVTIAPDDTVGMLLYKIATTAAKLLMHVLLAYKEGRPLPRTPQNSEVASYAPLTQPVDLRIDWNCSALEIYNLIRAGNPVGGAWAIFRGFQMKIWHATVVIDSEDIPECRTIAEPGKMVVARTRKQLYVCTGKGFLELSVVQPALYYIVDGWSFVAKALVKNAEMLT